MPMEQPQRVVKIGFDAQDIKDALRRHHPGEKQGSFVGRWTTIEEWCGIDLLALDAWRPAQVIGYEVKVSRSDMRTELLNPSKRAEAVSRCTSFYFATPAGMLKDEEIAFEEPEWSYEDFARCSCPGPPVIHPNREAERWHDRWGGQCRNPRVSRRGRRRSSWMPKNTPKGSLVTMPVPRVIQVPEYKSEVNLYDLARYIELQGQEAVTCPACGGSGYSSKSKVELEAPTLWIPRDVGLVEIHTTGIRIVKVAPTNKLPKPIIGAPSKYSDEVQRNRADRQALNDFARWVSNRPDPRHIRSYSDRIEP